MSAGFKRTHEQAEADGNSAGRCVQPRHFHAHTAPLPSASAQAAAPLPWLHRHALESIFSFLPLSTLAVLMSVSMEWRAAVLSMAPLLCIKVFLGHDEPWALFTASPQ